MGQSTFRVEAYRLNSDTSDEQCINRAITAAQNFISSANGSAATITLQAGRTYRVNISGTVTVLNPSGNSGTRSYCISPLSSGMTFDGNGASMQLQGSTQATLFTNTNVGGTARNSNISIRNITLDGNNIAASSHALVQLPI